MAGEEQTQLPARGRRRSLAISKDENPLDCPNTDEEFKLSKLRAEIIAKQSPPKQRVTPDSPFSAHQRVLSEAINGAIRALPPVIDFPKPIEGRTPKPVMNYQNYLDSPAGSGSNPRQAPPSPSQGMQHANGMNGGGMGVGGGLVGYPTPAGHQSDLNYVMSMVEELSQVLRTNQQLTNGVVDKMGKLREKAQHMNLSNDEVVAAVASEINGNPSSLYHTISTN